jgi:hypothetical protein
VHIGPHGGTRPSTPEGVTLGKQRPYAKSDSFPQSLVLSEFRGKPLDQSGRPDDRTLPQACPGGGVVTVARAVATAALTVVAMLYIFGIAPR